MRVLFVYTLRDCLTLKKPLASFQDIHIGISYLSSALESHNHETKLVVLSSENRESSSLILQHILADFDPDIVGFTAVSTQYPFVRKLAKEVKSLWPEKFLVIGGSHISLDPESICWDEFDALCIGEGEDPLCELVDQLRSGRNPKGIPNLWIKDKNGTVERNPTRDFIGLLDGLSFPDREIWRSWVLDAHGHKQVILPSRGCPYNCAYCSNHALRRLAGGRYVRFRSPADIIDEIDSLKRLFPEMREIYLQSETIAVDLNWLDELCNMIGHFNFAIDQPIVFACNFRIAKRYIDDKIFEALQRANVETIEIGLESGSERLRQEMLRRDYSNEDLYRVVDLARCRGMKVNLYNMIGLPEETFDDYLQTIEVNRRVNPNRSYTSIYFPYPGTDLYKLCMGRGLLTSGLDHTAERRVATLDLPNFSREAIQNAYDWFEFQIYKGHRSLPTRLRSVIRNKIESSPLMHRIFFLLLPLWQKIKKSN